MISRDGMTARNAAHRRTRPLVRLRPPPKYPTRRWIDDPTAKLLAARSRATSSTARPSAAREPRERSGDRRGPRERAEGGGRGGGRGGAGAPRGGGGGGAGGANPLG